MTLMIELSKEEEKQLWERAAQRGQDAPAYALDLVRQGIHAETTASKARLTATELMRMTPEERGPFLRAAAESAHPLYMEDLARPAADRVLTYDLENGEFLNYETGEMDG